MAKMNSIKHMKRDNQWKPCDTKVFWGEIAPCNHVLQIYEDDKVFLDSLEGFVSSGFEAGDSVIVIATAPHLIALDNLLNAHNFDTDALIASNQYIPLNAEETLAKFMVVGWPDRNLFMKLVNELIARARTNGRQVRAFGEMVAILWAQGYSGATVQIEQLWNEFCDTEAFCLFCAYPRSGFTEDATTSIMNICSAHSTMIEGSASKASELQYKSLYQ